MDKHMEKKKKWEALRTGLLTATAIMLVLSAMMGSVWAYFSTYATAQGGITLHMGHEEKVDEDFDSWQKVLNITSTPDSRPVYVRARGFCADYNLSYSGQNWGELQDDGWVYYQGKDSKQPCLLPGESLNPYEKGADKQYPGDALLVQILDVPSSGDVTLKDADSFNVIVVYETTEIQYDTKGDIIPPEKADWSRKVQTYRAGNGTNTEKAATENTDTGSTESDNAEEENGGGEN
jgi:hypothetical protein